VYYGRERLPGRGEFAQGGIVKCQDLQTVFPNVPRSPNIVYLVSSALPPAAVALTRFAHRAGARVVLNQNGVAYPAWHGPGWERANRPLAALLDRADFVIYQTRFCRETADRFVARRGGPSEVLHNPVDTTVFAPPAADAAEKGPILLAAGSHMQFYRVEAAVRALARLVGELPHARLRVAGFLGWRARERAARAELLALCRELRVENRVDLRGRYTQEEAVPLLRGVHILLQTKYNDPCPRLVVEAMACGRPVVYSASGGVPELVGPDAGVGVPVPEDWNRLHAPDPDGLAQAVCRVWRRYREYSDAARRRAVTALDVRAWLDRHRAIFEGLLE
jgi:glycosyltransferase involved in cell wall biosynthesis